MADPSVKSEPVLLEETLNGVRTLRLNRPERAKILGLNAARLFGLSVPGGKGTA